MIVDELLGRLDKTRRNGDGWTAKCPAHEDDQPSLRVSQGDDGRLLLHCHAGCDTEMVVAAIGLGMRDLFPPAPNREIVATYDYTDEAGKLLSQVVRYDPKGFHNRRPGAPGEPPWIWNLNGVRRVLYRLPEVLAEKNHIFIFEGEKDVDAATGPELTATTNLGGAGKWRDEYAESLAHVSKVTVVADRDDAGRSHARAIATSLRAAGINVEVVQPPEGHKDISDMLAAGLTRKDLEPLGDGEEATTPGQEQISAFEFLTLAQMGKRVDEAGPRKYLIRGIWAADAYGVLAGPMKAQKTMTMADAAVSVASGTPWLNHFPIDDPGPVLMFAGEGGAASIVRRLRAVCDNRNLDPDSLPIHICTRAPHLRSDEHMEIFAAKVEEIRPKLVILDPFYLSAAGAKSSDLYGMGELLERAQLICDSTNTALIVVTHFNRGHRSGAERITGAGPAEWGRVLIGVDVKSRHTERDTKGTTVVTAYDVIGGEVPDQSWTVKRTIVADDPDSLDSPLRYTVEVLESEEDNADDDMPPARRKLLEAVAAIGTDGATSRELVDWIADKYGHGLRRQTVSTELNAAQTDGLVDSLAEPGKPTIWFTPGVSAPVSGHLPGHPLTGDPPGVSSASAHISADDTLTPPNDTLDLSANRELFDNETDRIAP